MVSVTGAVLLLMVAVTGCHGFACFVCLPPVTGTQAEMNKAMQVRAEITRSWPEIPESQMGECPSMEPSEKYMLECPTDDEFTTCSKTSALTGAWTAHSCGIISKTQGIGCYESSASNLCMCASPLCNSPANRSAPLGSAVAMLAALVVARALTQ